MVCEWRQRNMNCYFNCMHEESLNKQTSLKAAVPLLQMPSYAGAVDCVHTAPPGPDPPCVAHSPFQVTWRKPWYHWWGGLAEAKPKGPPPNASLDPHGISTWNILSVTGILLKHRLCKQLQSCGRSPSLQPEALESRHCSAVYPRHWLTCKGASSSIAYRSCPDFNSIVWEWIKRSELVCKQWSITCVNWGCYLKPFHAHTAWLWLLSRVASKVLWLVRGPEIPWHVHCLGHLVYSLLA